MNKKKLFIVPLSFFIIDYLLVYNHIIQPLDDVIYAAVCRLRSVPLTAFFKIITNMGSFYFYAVSLFLLTVFQNRNNLLNACHLAIIQMLNRIIKLSVKRARPSKVLRLIAERGYSFPSGHSMSAMGMYGLWIIQVKESHLRYKNILMVCLSLMIFLIGFSRIYLGVHYFSDVLGGFLLSLSYLLFVYYNTDYYLK